MKNKKLPPLGMRTVKTALVVFISLLVSALRRGISQPFDIAFAAVLCIQPTMDSLKTAGKKRMLGTMIGGLWGSIIFLTNVYLLNNVHFIFRYVLISVAIIPVIYSLLLLKKADSIPIACATYLILTINRAATSDPFMFLCNRLLDTFTGILVAYVINSIYLPKETNEK